MAIATATLPLLDKAKTLTRPAFRSGKPTIVDTVTADGRWRIVRMEDRGTWWDLYELDPSTGKPTGRWLPCAGATLRAVRELAAWDGVGSELIGGGPR